MPIVDTEAIALISGPLLVQNLGPDPLYVGHSSMSGSPLATPGAGLRLVSGESVAIGPTSSAVSVVSSGESDVRLLSSGLGVFAAAVPPA